MSTVFASITTPGPPGPPGRTGLWLTGTVPPVTAQGLDGDMYLNSVTGDVYGPKASVWGGIVANIKGTTGAAGPTGPPGYAPLYIVAPGPPATITGNNGDMYLNSSTSDLYGPKAAGAWGGIVANIKGAVGPPGAAFVPRGAWSSVVTYNQGDEVTDVGVLYIALQGGNLNHVPLSSPTWWAPLTGGGGSQTPWLSNIDAATHNLTNVGQLAVGLISPLATLHVRSTANQNLQIGSMAWALAGAVGLNAVNDANNATIPLVFNATISSFFGTVGVGTVAPQCALDTTGVIRTTGFAGSLPTSGAGMELFYNGGGYIQAYKRDAPAGVTNLYLSGAQILLNLNGGNVGIGTAAPQDILHIARIQSAAITSIIVDNSGSGNGTGAAFRFGYGAGTILGGIYHFLNAGSQWCLGLRAWNNSAEIERVTINGITGNVGIGTAVAAYPLHVSGLVYGPPSLTYHDPHTMFGLEVPGNAELAIGWNNAGSFPFWIQARNTGGASSPLSLNPSGGNVGIGTANATAKLTIDLGTGAISTPVTSILLNALYGSASAGQGLDWSVNSSPYKEMRVVGTLNAAGDAGELAFYTNVNVTAANGTEKMRITGAGIVAIGTAAPQGVKLSLVPTTNATTVAGANFLTLGEATNTSGYYMSLGYFLDGSSIWKGSIQALVGGAAGNLVINGLGGGVGVCKVSPINYALDVAGDVNCSGSFRVNGTPISTGGITTQRVATGSRVSSTSYLNDTGKPMFVIACASASAGSTPNAYTDTGNPPTTQVVSAFASSSTLGVVLSFWVLPGSWYRVLFPGTITSWIEWF